jgi:hypothetical protein
MRNASCRSARCSQRAHKARKACSQRGESGRDAARQVIHKGTPTPMRHVRPEEDARFLPRPDATDRARC